MTFTNQARALPLNEFYDSESSFGEAMAAQEGEGRRRVGSSEHIRRKYMRAHRKPISFFSRRRKKVLAAIEACWNEHNFDVLDCWKSLCDTRDDWSDEVHPSFNKTIIGKIHFHLGDRNKCYHTKTDPEAKMFIFRALMRGGDMPLVFINAIDKMMDRIDDMGCRDGVRAVVDELEQFIELKKQILWLAEHGVERDRYIKEGIQEMERLLPEVKAVGWKLRWGGGFDEDSNMKHIRLYVSYALHYPHTILYDRNVGKRLIGATRYHIGHYWSKDNAEWQYGEILGESVYGDRINPHIGGGSGSGLSTVCLGGFAYALAQCGVQEEWGEFAYTLLEFHRTVDVTDTWGKHVHTHPKVWHVAGTREPVLDKSVRNTYGMRDLTTVAPDGHYIRGSTVYPQHEYALCVVTGKPIKRENAHRVPLYMSDEGLRLFSGENKKNSMSAFSMLRASGRISRIDMDKLMNKGDELWKGYHNRQMDNYQTECEGFVSRKEQDMLRKLQNDSI